MKLTKFLLRYFPPGIALEYVSDGVVENKMINLFDLRTNSNIEDLADEIMKNEQVITDKSKPQLISSLKKLQRKLIEDTSHVYGMHKVMKHILPVTNIVFNKDGNKCLTGSFDRTCKIWDTNSGQLNSTLEGHTSVVYDVAFNYPYCDRVLTASFDRTSSVWDSETGERLVTMWGHISEVVVIKYDNTKQHVATGSMDRTARVFDINTGLEMWVLEGHGCAIVKLKFSNDGRQLLTGSFDSTVILWDTRTKSIIKKFTNHKKPVTNCKFNFDCTTIATSSLDGTIKLYDCRQFKCRSTIYHGDDVLDIAFDNVGRRLVSCGSEGICKVWNVNDNISPICTLIGHQGEVSQAEFSPGGGMILTGSSDCTARLWNPDTSDCNQILEGHTDEIFSCGFTYDGSTIVTASKDNTCRLWKAQNLEDIEESSIDIKQNVTSLDSEHSSTMSV
ncbi:hypothetical protein O3M35_009810 [Rhynocoris fuscipes]|uniref:Uncharacterized protein n=1 Tax=Rhynocoris fuscipes TaxID=488301 RepID=A0AAW1D5J5_9HEMI